jgi:hypothetical protein
MRSVVVLPHPEGPSIEKNSPRSMAKFASSTATNVPNRLTTWSRVMTGSREAVGPIAPAGEAAAVTEL